MSKEDEVRILIKKHFWDMPDDASLNTGKKVVLPEDAENFLEEYFKTFKIDVTGFKFHRYFPNEGVWFLPNAILPKYMRTDKHKPEPLTVAMLIESARAGRWLYD